MRLPNSIIQHFKAPFTTEWKTYLILLSSVFLYIFGYWLSSQTGFVVFACSLFYIYCISVIVSLLPDILKKITMAIIYIYIYIVAALTFFGGLFTKTPDPMYTLMLVLQTNNNEISDFFHTYVTTTSALITTICFVFLAALYDILKNSYTISIWRHRHVRVMISFSLIMGCSLMVKGITMAMPITVPFAKPLDNFIIKDLNQYARKPILVETNSNHPQYLVLIIGESFSKSHSSLYNYAKPTNPRLQSLLDNNELFVFNNVASSTAYTGTAFKDIMSTYSSRNRDEKWYECQTIPTIMKAEGYNTIWISNQQAMGLYDAVPSHYSELCNITEFTPPGNHYDGELVKYVQRHLSKNKPTDKEFYVIHLMGSHEDFKKRYPGDFNKFKPDDYMELPESQRHIIAEYDNSILYNDFVISDLINLFKNKNACVIYFPDHALDLFESDNDYFGHANGTESSQHVARQIPFMVYISKEFVQKDSCIYQKIINNTNQPFSTQDVIYSITDLSGYKFKDNNDVDKYSLFK